MRPHIAGSSSRRSSIRSFKTLLQRKSSRKLAEHPAQQNSRMNPSRTSTRAADTTIQKLNSRSTMISLRKRWSLSSTRSWWATSRSKARASSTSALLWESDFCTIQSPLKSMPSFRINSFCFLTSGNGVILNTSLFKSTKLLTRPHIKTCVASISRCTLTLQRERSLIISKPSLTLKIRPTKDFQYSFKRQSSRNTTWLPSKCSYSASSAQTTSSRPIWPNSCTSSSSRHLISRRIFFPWRA